MPKQSIKQQKHAYTLYEVIDMSFKITYKIHILCFIFSYLISILLMKQIDFMIEGWFLSGIYSFPTRFLWINFIIYLVFLMLPISMVHELLHGAVYKAYGYRVSYGFKYLYAYTKETSGRAIPKNQFIAVLLTPCIIISIIALLIGTHLSITIFVLNLLGSTGDLLMTLFIIKYKSTIKIMDKDYGFDII